MGNTVGPIPIDLDTVYWGAAGSWLDSPPDGMYVHITTTHNTIHNTILVREGGGGRTAIILTIIQVRGGKSLEPEK